MKVVVALIRLGMASHRAADEKAARVQDSGGMPLVGWPLLWSLLVLGSCGRYSIGDIPPEPTAGRETGQIRLTVVFTRCSGHRCRISERLNGLDVARNSQQNSQHGRRSSHALCALHTAGLGFDEEQGIRTPRFGL